MSMCFGNARYSATSARWGEVAVRKRGHAGPARGAKPSVMNQAANGQTQALFPGADIIIEHLTELAALIFGSYQARMITTGRIPCLHLVSQLEPDLSEDVLCDFSTDPPDYLTTGDNASAWPAAAAAAGLARTLNADGTGSG